jgi:hypothetical protein
MKQFLASVLVLSMFFAATVGCVERSSTTKETEVSTPAETTTIITQQQGRASARQHGGFKGEQQNGAHSQQQGRPKDQNQGLSDGQQQVASDGQHQGESKDEKQSGSNVQQERAAQNQPPDDSTKKEKKHQPNKETGDANQSE